MHSKNIIHRDIKSPNILVTKEGLCKVSDFDIASTVSEKAMLSTPFAGSPYWMVHPIISITPLSSLFSSLSLVSLEYRFNNDDYAQSFNKKTKNQNKRRQRLLKWKKLKHQLTFGVLVALLLVSSSVFVFAFANTGVSLVHQQNQIKKTELMTGKPPHHDVGPMFVLVHIIEGKTFFKMFDSRKKKGEKGLNSC